MLETRRKCVNCAQRFPILAAYLTKPTNVVNRVSAENMSMPKPNKSQMKSIVKRQKRKFPDTPNDDSAAKRPVRQNPQHAHLAVQNSMLASMLAQTPRTAPSVPTSVTNAIVPQLPQKRLPKELEKNADGTSDPLLSDILDQVWSIQEEMNIGPHLTTAQDVNEEMAIIAIKRQLMSFEVPTASTPPQSPSQLSPGQRQQPSIFPMPQQGYSNNYPQSRLSPHLPSQPGPNQAWVQQRATNLHQQDPMLNAQLPQQQAALVSRVQFCQIMAQSMPSPRSRNSPYSNPPDSPFHPPSPGVALYQQQHQALPQQPAPVSQQRLQNAMSIPELCSISINL